MKNNQLTLPPHQKCHRDKIRSKLLQYCRRGLSSCLGGHLPRKMSCCATKSFLLWEWYGSTLAKMLVWAVGNRNWRLCVTLHKFQFLMLSKVL